MADQSFDLDVLNDLLDEAGVVGQLAADEQLFVAAYEAFRAEDRAAFQAALERLELVEKRDRAALERFVQAQKLGPFCHFFCHWVCLVRYRLNCSWVCDPEVQD